MIKEQYKLESIGINKLDNNYNLSDQRAVEILNTTTERLPSGRFVVGLPWRQDSITVPDSYYQAESRLKGLERRMATDIAFAEAYRTYMADMVSKGYAEECDTDTYHTKDTCKGVVHTAAASPRWYLPHFGIYHPQKKKLRVVHDAAAKTHGVSLNTLLLPGPDLLQSLLGILLRFREGRIAMTADIKEMFPQTRIRTQDRDSLRYLWRSDPGLPIKEFRMTSVIFGACCSPFIAQFVKNKNAEYLAHLYPAAADAVIHDHYMDDFIGSLDNVSEAASLAADIVTIHKAACCEMRGWISNDDRALALVPRELCAAPTPEVDLGSPVCALGVIWYPKEDSLGFRTGLDPNFLDHNQRLTKRKILSQLMRVYDPLGLLTPIVVKGRIMFQALWRSNVGWDEQFSQSETNTWLTWFTELTSTGTIHIPRCYDKSDILERELHVFADASELAYACVAYWRFTLADGSIKLALIGSKARVTPLKPVTIPRLELQAAVIASRFAATIIESHRNKPIRVVYWCDSRTVLSWLRADARTFRPFVAHRVGEIIENSNVGDWRWVPTELNVADDATKIRAIESSSRWFVGPSFLLHSANRWPTEPTAVVAPLLTELKTSTMWEVVGFTSVRELVPTPITADPAHFSDWTRLVRATARAHQAANIFKKLLGPHRSNSKFRNNSFSTPSTHSHNCNSSSDHRSSGIQMSTTATDLPPLSADNIKVAEEHIVRKCQLETFEEELRCLLASQGIPKNSPLRKLSPALGEDNVLRLAGRIRAAPDVSPDTKSPIILDGRHPISRLLIYNYYKIMAHANNETVVNEVRQKYWILHLRPTARTVAKKCLVCRIRNARPTAPPTADLPAERLAHHQRPFTHVGLDYFGPLEVTIGRRKEKRYVALYTCLTVRAMHLEVVNSLSTDSAIMSLRRFIARRGSPNTIWSDNGTAFVGASNELKQFFGRDVEDFVSTRGITWKFIPPAAPSFGGCWERLVRSTKTALRATLNQKAPKEETFLTLLLEAEAIVNSRPLSHVSVDTDAEEALTPFHFLIGESSHITSFTTPLFSDTVLVGRSEWRKASRLADHFWTRWVREVLPLLHTRPPASATPRKMNIGDIVVIADENLPRRVWPKGRVTRLHPGRDGIVRVVDISTRGGTLRRPVRKVVAFRT